ncbi:unnamed protein product, partial [Ectocarpus sp. 8 AP-2014]
LVFLATAAVGAIFRGGNQRRKGPQGTLPFFPLGVDGEISERTFGARGSRQAETIPRGGGRRRARRHFPDARRSGRGCGSGGAHPSRREREAMARVCHGRFSYLENA